MANAYAHRGAKARVRVPSLPFSSRWRTYKRDRARTQGFAPGSQAVVNLALIDK